MAQRQGGNTKGSASRSSGGSGNSRSSSSRQSSSSRKTQGSGSSGNRKGGSSKPKAQPQPQPEESEVTFADYLHAFTKTRAFMPVMVILVTIAVVLLDLLFAWNKYDLFFKILGFEILILAVIWIFGLIMSMSTTAPSPRPREEDDQ